MWVLLNIYLKELLKNIFYVSYNKVYLKDLLWGLLLNVYLKWF